LDELFKGPLSLTHCMKATLSVEVRHVAAHARKAGAFAPAFLALLLLSC
jgi:hypothetical protein